MPRSYQTKSCDVSDVWTSKMSVSWKKKKRITRALEGFMNHQSSFSLLFWFNSLLWFTFMPLLHQSSSGFWASFVQGYFSHLEQTSCVSTSLEQSPHNNGSAFNGWCCTEFFRLTWEWFYLQKKKNSWIFQLDFGLLQKKSSWYLFSKIILTNERHHCHYIHTRNTRIVCN